MKGGAAAIVVLLVLVKLYQLGLATASARPEGLSSDPAQGRVVIDASSWAYKLAVKLGNPAPSADTIRFIEAWGQAEGSGATNNPLATTQDWAGATTYNSVGVKNYPTEEDGLDATVETLQQDYMGYADLSDGIRTNDVARAYRGLVSSPWGTDPSVVASVYNQVSKPVGVAAGTGKKCPYTETMSYDDSNGGFYARGAAAWSGQWGGLHLGVDFEGQEGDWVFAPFDLVIDPEGQGLGFYGEPAKYGKYIQGRFTQDGVLYYAGHLTEVFVQPGQFVPACTAIARLGATEFKHTHIKLGGPSAPVPCEGSTPGWDTGCIDPIEYWVTH